MATRSQQEIQDLIAALATTVQDATNQQAQSQAQLTQQVQDLNTALATTQQQLQALAAGGGAPAPPVPVAFAATPAQADVTSLLDYKSKYGSTVYEEGKKALYDEDKAFNLEREEASRFEKDVESRAKSMGWNNALQGITTYLDQDGQSINIITDYGRITKEEIKTQSEPLFLATGAKYQTRAAQNNKMMQLMLFDSLTKEAKTRVEIWKNEYEFSDGGTPAEPIIVAAALYKVIMKLTTLDDRSTDKALRDTIKNLPAYATSVNGDIDKINSYFDNALAQLQARGNDADDKEAILFQAYLQVPDQEFRRWVVRKKDDWYEQSGGMQNATYVNIMQLARQKYINLKLDDQHHWGAPSEEESKIIALEALLDKQLKLTKDLQGKVGKANTSTTPGKGKGKGGKGQQNQTKQKNQKNNENKKRQTEDEAWKKEAPKQGEPKTKLIGTRTWNWCHHHQAWTVHKSDECRLGKNQAKQRNNIANEATVDESDSSATQINPSYAAMLATIAAQAE